VGELVSREEAQAALEARRELGVEYEDPVVDALVEKIEQRLDRRDSELKRRRDHQKELILGSMGISIPLLGIAAVFAGLAGIALVCAALAVVALVAARST
jgi:small-conductance mechanosensitive channel